MRSLDCARDDKVCYLKFLFTAGNFGGSFDALRLLRMTGSASSPQIWFPSKSVPLKIDRERGNKSIPDRYIIRQEIGYEHFSS